jgi:hypothetical protein
MDIGGTECAPLGTGPQSPGLSCNSTIPSESNAAAGEVSCLTATIPRKLEWFSRGDGPLERHLQRIEAQYDPTISSA